MKDRKEIAGDLHDFEMKNNKIYLKEREKSGSKLLRSSLIQQERVTQ